MKSIGLLSLVLLLAACSVPAERESVTPPAPKAEEIVCHAAYRGNVSVGIEREEEMAFGDADEVQTLSFAELEFHGEYHTGEFDRERVLRLWVTEPGQTDSLTSQLYQLPLESGPVNQFIGGHGFTGLNYAYHTSGAELQFWCQAN